MGSKQGNWLLVIIGLLLGVAAMCVVNAMIWPEVEVTQVVYEGVECHAV